MVARLWWPRLLVAVVPQWDWWARLLVAVVPQWDWWPRLLVAVVPQWDLLWVTPPWVVSTPLLLLLLDLQNSLRKGREDLTINVPVVFMAHPFQCPE